MKINNIKINGFGKLKDKEIQLSNNLNVIYGENEAGKSTLLKFIPSMFYGISKNKAGKDITDYDKYKPWTGEEYSGKLSFTLDDGREYEVFRDFNKKAPVIYNDLKEDVTKTFTQDKSKGPKFFEDFTGIDEETYFNTAISEQGEVKISQLSQNSILQKISNLISTGDEKISYQKTREKIRKRQNHEVGTERTSQKPINIVNNKIYELSNKKEELESYKGRIADSVEEKEELEVELENNSVKKDFLTEIKFFKDDNKEKEADISASKKLESEFKEKYDELNKRLDKDFSEDSPKKKSLIGFYIVIPILIIAFVLLLVFNKTYWNYNFLMLLPIVITIGLMIFTIVSNKKSHKNTADEKQKLINELEFVTENVKRQEAKTQELEDVLNENVVAYREKIEKKYHDYIEKSFFDEMFSKDSDKILKELDAVNGRINTIQFKTHTLDLAIEEINEKEEKLASIEEELEAAIEEKGDLIKLNNSFNIAKEALDNAYSKVKANISPRFIGNLGDIVNKVSEGRYKTIAVSDTDGLNVEVENGNYVPASRLSTGTVDQIYLSLRLSAINEISNENMPLILDEAFAYYDNSRLENILKYLYKNFKESQIIIFTCSKREIEIFDKMKIDYNLINLEK